MSVQMDIGYTLTAPGISRSQTISKTSGALTLVNGEPAPAGVVTQFILSIDVSAIQSLWIESSVDCTLKTNSSGSPANTVALKAGRPLEWDANSYYTNKLTTDVTSLYFDVPAGTDAVIYVYALTDPTP